MNSIELGDSAFRSSLSTVISSIWNINDLIIDLPDLNTIKLGEYVLRGRNDESCSLKMEGNIDIIELIFRSSESRVDHL